MKMEIDGREVRSIFIKEEDREDGSFEYIWIIDFIKTPKGRRKRLLEVREEFDENLLLSKISLSFNHIRSSQERRLLLDHLSDSMSSDPDESNHFDVQMWEMLRLRFIVDIDSFFVSFA